MRLVLDIDDGSVAQVMRHDAWGVVLEDTMPSVQPFGFAGGLYDHETELVRFGARDYDPAIGRWMAKDPIRFEGGDTNLYAYTGSDPINGWDPEGKQSHDPSGLSNLCHAKGAPCPAFHTHPFSSQVGSLYFCRKTKSGFLPGARIKFTCSYKYPNGDQCTFFNGGAIGICNSFLPNSCDPHVECCDADATIDDDSDNL